MLESRKLGPRPLLWSYFKFMWSWPPPVFFSYYILEAYKNIHFFWSGSSKYNIFEKVVTLNILFFIALYTCDISKHVGRGSLFPKEYVVARILFDDKECSVSSERKKKERRNRVIVSISSTWKLKNSRGSSFPSKNTLSLGYSLTIKSVV